MKVLLENNLYLISDSKGWHLKKKNLSKNSKTGEVREVFARIKTYNNLSTLLDEFLDSKLRNTEGELSFSEMIECFKTHHREREEWFNKINDLFKGGNNG